MTANKTNIITLICNKGGVGRSTTAINYAWSLAIKDKKVSPQPLVSFERIIDNEGIPIECSINYVSDNINNHFEISIYLESKFSKDRMKWDGGDDPQRYEIGNYLKLNTSSAVIDGNLTANSNNISMIQ